MEDDEPSKLFFFCKGLNQRRWLTDALNFFSRHNFWQLFAKRKKVKKTSFEQIKFEKKSFQVLIKIKWKTAPSRRFISDFEWWSLNVSTWTRTPEARSRFARPWLDLRQRLRQSRCPDVRCRPRLLRLPRLPRSTSSWTTTTTRAARATSIEATSAGPWTRGSCRTRGPGLPCWGRSCLNNRPRPETWCSMRLKHFSWEGKEVSRGCWGYPCGAQVWRHQNKIDPFKCPNSDEGLKRTVFFFTFWTFVQSNVESSIQSFEWFWSLSRNSFNQRFVNTSLWLTLASVWRKWKNSSDLFSPLKINHRATLISDFHQIQHL